MLGCIDSNFISLAGGEIIKSLLIIEGISPWFAGWLQKNLLGFMFVIIQITANVFFPMVHLH